MKYKDKQVVKLTEQMAVQDEIKEAINKLRTNRKIEDWGYYIIYYSYFGTNRTSLGGISGYWVGTLQDAETRGGKYKEIVINDLED